MLAPSILVYSTESTIQFDRAGKRSSDSCLALSREPSRIDSRLVHRLLLMVTWHHLLLLLLTNPQKYRYSYSLSTSQSHGRLVSLLFLLLLLSLLLLRPSSSLLLVLVVVLLLLSPYHRPAD